MWEDIRFSASDGARLYARHYRGARNRRPVVCLGSYVGHSGDFEVLASALSRNGPESRSVFTLDGRGRGQSGYLPSEGKATVLVDAQDALDFMTLCGLDDAAVIGSGYGGQVAMVMALLRPRSVGLAIFNDSAPEFEAEGVVRILSEIACLPMAGTWDDAAALLKSLHAKRYPRLSNADWLAMAHVRFGETDGRPSRLCDPTLAQTFSFSRHGLPRHTLWPQFAAMKRVPIYVLRCELTDMVSPRTIRRMRDLHPTLEVATIANEGHPALLRDQASIAAIGQFLARHDGLDARGKPLAKAVA